MMGMKGNTRGIASRQPTCTGRRRNAHHARVIWRTSDTPPARVGLGKERPQARCGDRACGGVSMARMRGRPWARAGHEGG